MRHAETLRSDGGLEGSAAELDASVNHPRIAVWREGPHSVLVEWSLPRSPAPADYTWTVERSVSPGGPFRTVRALLASNALGGTWRDDDIPPGFENTRRLYYRVVLVPSEGSEVRYGLTPEWDRLSDGDTVWGVTWGLEGQRIDYVSGPAREARARFHMLSRQWDGEVGLAYRPDWLSGACPTCIDPRTGARHRGPTPCATCFGTGYRGGYCTPMQVRWIPRTGIPQRVDTPAGGHDLVEGTLFRFLAHPLLEPDDVVRTLSGKIWLLAQPEYEEFRGTVLLLNMTVTQLPTTHPLSSIPFPFDATQVSQFSRGSSGPVTDLDSLRKSAAEGRRANGSPRYADDPWGDDV